ncbi:MAG: amidohydrolase family protein [Dehalococcoidia bacterium]|nr:amidohydrolase family protein [Dehalococcoidia bacterium]
MTPSPLNPTQPLGVNDTGDLIWAIDPVVNVWTADDFAVFPDHLKDFWERIRLADAFKHGVEIEQMIDLMDQAAIEVAFLLAARGGEWEITYRRVYDVCERYPERFRPIAGIDPNRGLAGVKELEIAVTHYGFIGAHLYPHWFGMAPNHALYYPYYAKCAELEVPIQIQIGHSAQRRMPTVARPMTLDEVAIAMPELKIFAIHTGWPYIDEAISISWKHEHVYLGTDAHAPRYWEPAFIQHINTRGRRKVIFGTDWPIIDFARARKEILEIGIREASMPWLMRENCRRLYDLWDLPPTPGTEGQ